MSTHRDVAQMVAYHVRDVGVAGSSPVIPTFQYLRKCLFKFKVLPAAFVKFLKAVNACVVLPWLQLAEPLRV